MHVHSMRNGDIHQIFCFQEWGAWNQNQQVMNIDLLEILCQEVERDDAEESNLWIHEPEGFRN